PYKQKLISRGPDRTPRVISIPTIRDRLVLSAMKDFLHAHHPGAVPSDLPSKVVRNTVAFLATSAVTELTIIRLDIRDFFPSVSHERLMTMLGAGNGCRLARRLVYRSLRTPTLPLNTRRASRVAARNTRG